MDVNNYKVQITRDVDELSQQASQAIAAYIDIALDQKDRAQIALSGGSTPANAYSLLGKEHLPWDRVDIFLGDERWVSSSSDQSNAFMLRKTLLAPGPGSKAQFHPVPIEGMTTAEESAEAFENLIREIFGD